MRLGRRRPFADLIERQLSFFEQDHAALLEDARSAERAYDDADRDEATERYAEYDDLVETGTELLAGIRDAYAATLDEETAAEYERAFNEAVARRLPRFGVGLADA